LETGPGSLSRRKSNTDPLSLLFSCLIEMIARRAREYRGR
jgi:hypothetical protein